MQVRPARAQHDFEVEAVIGHDVDLGLLAIKENIPNGYRMRSTSNKTWQAVIEKIGSSQTSNSLETSIVELVSDLRSVLAVIAGPNCMVRVGVFFETSTCTTILQASTLSILSKEGLGVILTTYPCDGDLEDRDTAVEPLD